MIAPSLLRHALLGLAAALSAPTWAEPADPSCDLSRIERPLNLPDAVSLALCHNPQTRILWAAARAQAAQVGVSEAGYLPTLTASGSDSRNQNLTGGTTTVSNSRSAGLTVSYLLYDFGGRAANVESARQLLLAANATRDTTLQTTYLGTVQAWFALLTARANVATTVAAEVAARESLAAATARHQAGSATPADRLQAQTALSQAALNRITAEGNAASAAGTLANLMGFEANQPLQLTEGEPPRPDAHLDRQLGEMIAEARRKRPDLAAAEAQIKAAEAQVTAAWASGLPTIGLNANTGITRFNGGADARTNSLSLSVNIPLFTGRKTTYLTRAAEAQLEGKIADRDRIANQVALEVWKTWQTLLTSSQALQAADDLAASAEQSEHMILGRYQAGLGNMLDVLTAQSTLTSARQQQIAARYNFMASRFALAQAIGELDLTRPGMTP